MDTIYSATYSSVPVYEFKIENESVMRRRNDDWVNATHILKAAGFDKPARTRILEREVQKGVHEKVQGGYGKYQGTWIPLPEGRMLAERNNILTKLLPIFDYVAGDRSPPPAPKHTSASSKPRQPRKSTTKSTPTAIKTKRSMGPPIIPQEQYEMSTGFDDSESIEHATIESSSMIADEDMMQLSQNSGMKRKRGAEESSLISASNQEHTMYGDQLLDYFMTVGDDPQATRVNPPQPPTRFQIDRPIDDSGNTALHWACAMGDLEIVQDMLRRGADMKTLSVHEETPLVRAVLFTNNYEKRTFPALLELLLDTVSFRDWFGATLFHHIAETARSKGKWNSSLYYCEVILQKLCQAYQPVEIDILLACQDDNGDTAALVAARNGAFRLVNMLLPHCPRSGDLVNKRGDTANMILERAQYNNDMQMSSITMTNDHVDVEANGIVPADCQSVVAAVDPTATSDLLARVGAVMTEANKKLAVLYSNKSKPSHRKPDDSDVDNPEALYEHIEADRAKIRAETIALKTKLAGCGLLEEKQAEYESLYGDYQSLVEQLHTTRLATEISSVEEIPEVSGLSKNSQDDLLHIYQLARELFDAQLSRRDAVRELTQQSADAGGSTTLEHRKLVALATGLKEEDLDPMVAELAETLEFDRENSSPVPERRPSISRPDQLTSIPESRPGGPVDV
ncbi:KilA N-terminal/APSES-type HTH DNA-binding [Penicillium taxi]|uniref:KilA N-terminal/APSES-type HTH DNA-binding n=1 Tax=Penicillium taxi TaxID=168475 RepID=UPI002544D838|nr:KilA N-terminal/APSES-type HTH DNA-binding [Penicillium taxi]KAJ5884811.1 KilA N-terminal/APSES-type HTH DNA-binding [Penicillium taxi]